MPSDVLADKSLPDLTNAEFSSKQGILGAYDLLINRELVTAELVPSRINTIGEGFLVSGTSYFITNPCSHCFNIYSIGLTDENYIKITFSVDHPMDKGNPAEPPSGTNRLDLDIFDLILIIEPEFGTASYYPFLGDFGVYINDRICAYTDGYTDELAPIFYLPAVNPFYLVIDNTQSGSPVYNRFEMGTRNALFDTFIKSNLENFKLYLTFNYGLSVNGFEDRLNPVYFIPEFNRKAAWKVEVIPPQGDYPPGTGNTWNDFDTTTNYHITVKIYDWQQVSGVSSQYPDIDNPHRILSKSSVEKVSAVIPGMTDSYNMAMYPESGGGLPSNPLIVKIPFANENSLPAGEYPGLVEVLDSRISTWGGAYGKPDSLVYSPDGKKTEWYKPARFRTYQTFTATVVEYNPSECGAAIEIPQKGHVYGNLSAGERRWYRCFVPPAGIDDPSSIFVELSTGVIDISVYGIDPDSYCPGNLLNSVTDINSQRNINLAPTDLSCIYIDVVGKSGNSNYHIETDLSPAITDVAIEVYVATDDGSVNGTWPLSGYTELDHNTVVRMLTWANKIWNQYGYNLKWDGTEEIISSSYYHLGSFSEAEEMQNLYGKGTDKLSLYFVNDVPGWASTAFCRYEWGELDHNVDSVYSVYGPSVWDWHAVVAHEHGHALGRLIDQYYYWTWFSGCPCGDTRCLEEWLGFPAYLYSDPNACYDGNLMWFDMGWTWDRYDLRNGQWQHTNRFHFLYPDNFPMS